MEEKERPSSSEPIIMPPPADEQKSKPASFTDGTPEQLIERQERLRREWEEQQRKREEEALQKKKQEDEARRKREEEEALRRKQEAEALQKKQKEAAAAAARKKQEQEALRKAQQANQASPAQPNSIPSKVVSERHSPVETQKFVQDEPVPTQNEGDVIDNVKRVPDDQLPSHQERQRSNFEKRFSVFMDELLPKIAVVTQKVNTYTGTDYSGIEALRREIQEQGKSV